MLSSVFASLPDATGVTTSSSGDVYISYNDSTELARQEAIAEFNSSGEELNSAVITVSGTYALPGALTTLSSSAALPISGTDLDLAAGSVLEMQPDGEIFDYNPGSGASARIASASAPARSPILRSTTPRPGRTSTSAVRSARRRRPSAPSRSRRIHARHGRVEQLGFRPEGELCGTGRDPRLDGDGPDGCPGPLRLRAGALGPGGQRAGDRADEPPEHRGDRGAGVVQRPRVFAPTAASLGLPTAPGIAAGGISVDADGDFLIGAGATTLLQGAPSYVAVTPNLQQYSAVPTTPFANGGSAPLPVGIAPMPGISGGALVTLPGQGAVIEDGYYEPLTNYSPAQIRHAYGVNQISFTGTGGTTVQGNSLGQGQTIAIIEQGYDPTIASDLDTFSQYYGLPEPSSTTFNFTQVYENQPGTFTPVNQIIGTIPVVNATVGETALDVEWAHAIAPEANILLVEAAYNPTTSDPYDLTDFFEAVQYATQRASVVSISYGFPEFGVTDYEQDDTNQTKYDSILQATGVTVLASSGDSGEYPAARSGDLTDKGVEYPASSPDVVAVGGTTLPLDAAGDYPTGNSTPETGWETSQYQGAGAASARSNRADMADGRRLGRRHHRQAGRPGRGLGCRRDDRLQRLHQHVRHGRRRQRVARRRRHQRRRPQWAGLIAIVDQERAALDAAPLTGYNQTLPALYALPETDFHDILTDTDPLTASLQANSGYDLVTGRGSPVANLLVPDLASYDLATQLAVSAQPPSSVTAGSGFGLKIAVEDRLGDVITSYSGTVTIALGNNPGGGSLGGTLKVNVSNGVATFSGLTLDTADTGYTLVATATGLTSATTGSFNVVAAGSSKLVVATQPPATANVDDVFGLTIDVNDAYGNLATSFDGNVTMAVASNPGDSTLGGVLTVAAVNGVASFSDLDLNLPGTGYTLTAKSSGLTSATTGSFNVGFPGYAPSQIDTAYGINQIDFGTTAGTGSGQTIAVVKAYSDPSITGDLGQFDQMFGLPAANLTIVNEQGACVPSALRRSDRQLGGRGPPSTSNGRTPSPPEPRSSWSSAARNNDSDLFAVAAAAAACRASRSSSMSWRRVRIQRRDGLRRRLHHAERPPGRHLRGRRRRAGTAWSLPRGLAERAGRRRHQL